MRTDVIDFTILTSDLADLASRLRARGWLDADNNPVAGIHYVRLAPKVLVPGDPPVMDTLHRIYVRLYADKLLGELDGERTADAIALWTKFGRFVRENGIWDDTRKAWRIGTKFWLVKETDVVPDHAWQ